MEIKMDIEKLIYCDDDLDIFEIDDSTLEELSRIQDFNFNDFMED